MSAFCEPATHTSTCQSSVFRSVAPRPLMASTTSTAGVAATTSPIALMSLTTPVDVSLNCTNTALMAGSLASAAAISAGSALVPHSYSSAVTSAPHVLLSLMKRSPKLPTDATSTWSPGFTRLTTADSMTPGAGGGVDEHVVGGLVHALEAGDDLVEDLGEARRAVVHDRLAQGGEHLGRHGRRAGGQEKALQHRGSPFFGSGQVARRMRRVRATSSIRGAILLKAAAAAQS